MNPFSRMPSLCNVEEHSLRHLAEVESKRNALTTREFEKRMAWRKGKLEAFECQLADYIKGMIVLRQKAKSKRNLVEAPTLSAGEELKWLVLYQVPDTDGSCLSYRRIANLKNHSAIHIRKRVQRAARLIELDLRDRYMHSGRPRGTGKPITLRATR